LNFVLGLKRLLVRLHFTRLDWISYRPWSSDVFSEPFQKSRLSP
jgi:hypothetical protein